MVRVWLPCSVASPLLAVSLLLLVPSGAVAQAPPGSATSIPDCVGADLGLSAQYTDVGVAQNNSGPPDGSSAPNWAVHTRDLMSNFVVCSLDFAQNDIVPRVLPWFNAILVIMVVWTGVTVMFSGSSVQTLLPFILLAGFASGLMHTYYSPTPIADAFLGLDQGLAFTVLSGAEAVANTLFEQADEIYYDAFDTAREVVEQRNSQLIVGSGTSFAGILTRVLMATITGSITGTAVGPLGTVGVGVGAGAGMAAVEYNEWSDAFMATVWSILVMGVMYSFLGLLHLAYWIIMAQYMWGYFSMAVIAVVGPFFIPLVLVPQTQDYFWGWFKALVNSAFYMITAAALYVIIALVLMLPLEFLTGNAGTPPTDARTSFAGLMEFTTNLFTQYLPVIAMALLGALQVGGIANSMTSGSQPPGAGLAGRIAQVGGAGAAVAGARNFVRDKYNQFQAHRAGVLSGDMRRRRQAVESGAPRRRGERGRDPGHDTCSRRLLGGGPGPGLPGGAGGGPRSSPAAVRTGSGAGGRSPDGGRVPAALLSPGFKLFERRIRQLGSRARWPRARGLQARRPQRQSLS